MALAAVAGSFVVHKLVSEHELGKDRQALLAKQRAVAATLGAEWVPLRDELEAEVLGAAKEYAGDAIDPEARRGDFRTQPGLYLRMRVADAGDAAAIRAVAADGKRDAFAACLLREPNDRGARGEVDGGVFAEATATQPWNLGQAYAATRILTDAWTGEVRAADDALRLRVFAEQYDEAVRKDVPLAIDVVKRASFFLLVLDEDAPGAAAPDGGAGGGATEEALQLVAHPVRVHLFDLPSGREILRLRRTADVERVIQAGERRVTDQETVDAMQRQADNCALANVVTRELALPAPTASAPPVGR